MAPKKASAPEVAHGPLMTAEEAAKYLGVKVRWLRSARERNFLTVVRLGDHYVRYRQSDLDRLIDQGIEEAPPSDRKMKPRTVRPRRASR